MLYNQYVNTGDARDRGLELAATWKPSKDFSAGANATWIDFTLGDTDTRPTYTPAFKGNLWVRATLYSRNALKGYTDQGGGGGPTRQAILQAARRETGLTFSYRF